MGQCGTALSDRETREIWALQSRGPFPVVRDALAAGTRDGLSLAVRMMRTVWTPKTLPLLSHPPQSDTLWELFLSHPIEDKPENASLVRSALGLFLDAAHHQQLCAAHEPPTGSPSDPRSTELVGASYLLNRQCSGTMWGLLHMPALLRCLMVRYDLLTSALLSLSTERYLLSIDGVTQEDWLPDCEALHIALLPVRAHPSIICSLIDRTSNINRGRWRSWSDQPTQDGFMVASCATPLDIAIRHNNVDAVLYLLGTRWMDLDLAAASVPHDLPASVMQRGYRVVTPWELLFWGRRPDSRVAAAWNRAIASLSHLRSTCARLLLDRYGVPAELANIIFAYLLVNPPGTIPFAP